MKQVAAKARGLKAAPLLKKGNRGGTRPGHVWLERAPFDLLCEGITNPMAIGRRIFAAGHTDIVRGDRYLKKLWRLEDGQEFASRHCVPCGRELEKC